MNIVVLNYIPTQIVAGLKASVLMLIASSLLSYDGGGNISIGSSQSSEPVVVDCPLFYLKKRLPVDNTGELVQVDVHDLLSVQFSTYLYMHVQALVSAPDINLTGGHTQSLGDVPDISVNHDGAKVLFSMRYPVDSMVTEAGPLYGFWVYDYGNNMHRNIVIAELDTVFHRYDISGVYPNWLPVAELGLIAEWLSLGAQYYNAPFSSVS
ncbi:MAG: hypothetical protein GY727_04380 [Gammaproteobacteria bacterium]|nr:hypothetical protein [Gammaproteobacteria bacterium]MCP4090078.1 hypothetical protein [Gammaproteobacteria bacterium]MCP4277032.1 hypothetical protein [Gammaproteobacteria bacterium]MCP4832745.1 hypothetical protein [Gammaproteobacteria bacterium]MCP4929938.1 hypothetical protein [Gammaproteobacteria bacterium]